jgi:hypothetical protein
MTDYDITDGIFREYTADDLPAGTYINPKRITVSIDPDTAKAAVMLTGMTTRGELSTRRAATHSDLYDDWATALDDPAVDSLTRAAIIDTARWSADLASLLHPKHLA